MAQVIAYYTEKEYAFKSRVMVKVYSIIKITNRASPTFKLWANKIWHLVALGITTACRQILQTDPARWKNFIICTIYLQLIPASQIVGHLKSSLVQGT